MARYKMKEGCWHNGRMALVLLLMSSYLNHWRQKQWTVMGQYKPSQALVLHVRAHLKVGIPRVLACCLSHGGKSHGPRRARGALRGVGHCTVLLLLVS